MTNFISTYLGIQPNLQSKIFASLVILIIAWLIRKIFSTFVVDKLDDPKLKYQWQKFLKNIVVILTVILLVRTWFGAFESIGTYFGLLSAGLAIAFQDLLVNFAGWFFILLRKPFKTGDRIEIDGIIGDVIDIRIFQFSVIEIGNWVDAEQSTGRIIHIPNGTVFKTSQANYNEGFEYIWHEIPVLLTFESDWKKAKQILYETIQKHGVQLSKEAERQLKDAAKKFLIFYKKLTPVVYTTVKDSGVLLTIRFLCHIRQKRSIEELIWEEILDRFAEHKDIDFAYPTIRYYNNKTEGKEA